MLHEILRNIDVVLASQSPRRKELFALLGINHRALPADIPEPITDDAPEIQALHYAIRKAKVIANIGYSNSMIVSADTVVDVDNIVLGKPANAIQAKHFLSMLSGREHYVHTGICILYKGIEYTSSECTRVQFATLSTEEIDNYIATNEPFDKAGAYGIQGYGAQFVTSIIGCYFNVMGFPVRKFYELVFNLKQDGII